MTATAQQRGGDAPDPATLDPEERMGLDEQLALQLARLQQTLRAAYEHVPHHRRAFDAAGVHPDDCRELADLARFPTSGKELVKHTIGTSVEVAVVDPESLERSVGKLKRLVDLRGRTGA